jgi:hypothetical protein
MSDLAPLVITYFTGVDGQDIDTLLGTLRILG